MLMVEKTIQEFGYDPTNFHKWNQSKVCIQCDNCGIIKRIQFKTYKMKEKGDLCRFCAHSQKDDKVFDFSGIMIQETIDKFGYDPTKLSVASERDIIVVCSLCKESRVQKFYAWYKSPNKMCTSCSIKYINQKRLDALPELTEEFKRERKRQNVKKCIDKKKHKEEFILIKRLRNSFYLAIKGRCGKGAFRHLPYTKEEFVAHIQNKLKERNYICPLCKQADLNEAFHVDHKYPLSKAKTVEEVKKLFEFSNLDVLCPKCNYRKHANIIDY